ncbi:MAG: zinc ribbon domain-containing protein [Candidatus Caldarchaeum sp.]|nr:zinc ribbon domain-containing protein [Candidatus Caldarchaeum sp.]MDW8359600.1 zinc ribbon domain-containing protein [Candidatus Caldarchaeum sp.]
MVGSVGKGLGARYGSTVRKKWSEVVKSARSSYVCEKCGAKKVRRVSVGVWMCRGCGFKFAGQAYEPRVEK